MRTPHDDSTNANARTQAMLARLRKAMTEIEAEIAAHHGVYPYNHGRVTQSELCRRADVKKATLQTPLHKDTTRVDVLRWLDGLAGQLGQTRDAHRDRVWALPEVPAHLQPGQRLRHYKGGHYAVVGHCTIEATLGVGVLYRPLQGNAQTLWLRPLAEFDDEVSTPEGVVRRFVSVD